MVRSMRWLWAVLILVGCGGGAGHFDDAAVAPGRQIRIVSPGRDVGVATGAQVLLEVQVLDSTGSAVSDAVVSFSIQGDAAGAVLAKDTVITTGQGVASAMLKAGWQEASFHVKVSSSGAASQRFAVVVSNAGFGGVNVGIDYRGSSGLSSASRFQVRVFLHHSCLDLIGSDIPDKERFLEDVADHADIEYVPVDTLAALQVRAMTDTSALVAAGCVDLPVGSLHEGVCLDVAVPLDDFVSTPGDSYGLVSSVELESGAADPDLRTAVDALAGWGRCAYGLATPLLDCIGAALDRPDLSPEDLDCTTPAVSQIARNLADRRSEKQGRCPGALDRFGRESLEKLLEESLVPASVVERLQEVGVDDSGLFAFDVLSSLFLDPTGSSDWSLDHSLLAVQFSRLTEQPVVSLLDLGLSVRTVRHVRMRVSTTGTYVIDREVFSFPLARITESLFRSWAFGAPSARDWTSILEVAWSGGDNGGGSACEQVDALICTQLHDSSGCVLQACQTAMSALGLRLDQEFADAALNGVSSLSLLAGRVSLADLDGDGQAEQLGTKLAPGVWNARMDTSGGSIPVQATFMGFVSVMPLL